jgi:hypothetical protein
LKQINEQESIKEDVTKSEQESEDDEKSDNEEEIKKGNKIPDEVLRAYEELYKHWQLQMNRELS